MEGKRAAAIVALCMLMLLSGQQQVAAMSEFCVCYRKCYTDCRWRSPRFLCVPQCLFDCSPLGDGFDDLTSAGDCNKICLTSICGSAAADTNGATACVDNCTKNRSQYGKHL